MSKESNQTPQSVLEAVLKKSEPIHPDAKKVIGYDFNQGLDYHKLFQSYATTGYQATNIGKAIEIINQMIEWKYTPSPEDNDDGGEIKCKIFLGYTSNLVSSGLREIIRYLVQHNMVDCIVASAGGVEEDFIKCLGDTFIGDFALDGQELRKKGLNRIGNLLVPNDNYCKFEDWILPILDNLLKEQKEQGINWTPSKIISRLGKEINHEDSIYYWAYKNNIPVYCPAITDGSLGDMIYFHSYKNPGLIVDLVEDIRSINDQAVFAKKTGMIILGGGVVKHHICNANLMRNGADYAVYINTGQEFDGSDAGARPDEAVSWGKIRGDAQSVKIFADASIVFPFIVAETFVKSKLG
ncbi:DHS-like NAD/FAD-binding domain-containing protein [Globomyces pollinis-pini]|nr:DHS-like NAD/FAD-binding domain-containing protein [Globomyces pollinis-pini]